MLHEYTFQCFLNTEICTKSKRKFDCITLGSTWLTFAAQLAKWSFDLVSIPKLNYREELLLYVWSSSPQRHLHEKSTDVHCSIAAERMGDFSLYTLTAKCEKKLNNKMISTTVRKPQQKTKNKEVLWTKFSSSYRKSRPHSNSSKNCWEPSLPHESIVFFTQTLSIENAFSRMQVLKHTFRGQCIALLGTNTYLDAMELWFARYAASKKNSNKSTCWCAIKLSKQRSTLWWIAIRQLSVGL